MLCKFPVKIQNIGGQAGLNWEVGIDIHTTTDKKDRTSLVVQWRRIHLPKQRMRVWSLVWEVSAGRGATKPRCQDKSSLSSGACTPQCWAHVLQLLSPVHLEPVLTTRSHHHEKLVHSSEGSPPLLHAATKTQCNKKKKNHHKSYKLDN